jgi:hypothetical protein
MVRRPSDQTPDPPGGRAAERLRMFEDARGPKENLPEKKSKKSRRKGAKSNEKQIRRKD